jgi:dTDP-4-dehydrorhamnose 3,5-epimerase
MEFIETKLPGCFEIRPKVFADDRGRFVKVYHEQLFAERGLVSRWSEINYSTSRKNVLRGLHFQIPPADHAKLVYCIVGRIIDVAVDLRVGSPNFGKFHLFELDPEKANGAYLPRGMAHGFYVLSDTATLAYEVETVYSPAHDSGIRWDSCGIPWPEMKPVLSEKDRKLPGLAEFVSPFRYQEGK